MDRRVPPSKADPGALTFFGKKGWSSSPPAARARGPVISQNPASAVGPHKPPATLLYPLIIFFLIIVSSCAKDPAGETFDRAENLFADGMFTEAIAAYSEVVRLYPESPYAPKSQLKLGLIYGRHLKDFKKALDAYSKLFFLYPRSKETIVAHRERAHIFSELGDPRRAIEEYQILLEKDTFGKKDLYQYSIAMEYVKLNDLVQARIELQDLIDAYPSSGLLPEAYYQVANTFYLEGRLKEAVKSFDKVIDRFGDLPVALEAALGKAASLEELGELTEALGILEDLKDHYPNPKVVETRIEWIKKRLKEGPRKVKVKSKSKSRSKRGHKTKKRKKR